MSGSNREPQPIDGPDYHAEHAAWRERNRARRGVSTPNPTHIIADHRVNLTWSRWLNYDGAEESGVEVIRCTCTCGHDEMDLDEHAAHVVSKLTDAGYSIVASDDVELLRRIRWTVDGSAPIDLKDEYADGFNAAMRNIHRLLHLADAAEGETP